MMPVPMTTAAVPAASMAPAVPVPAAIIPAVEAMPPIWPIVASVAVVARIVAVAERDHRNSRRTTANNSRYQKRKSPALEPGSEKQRAGRMLRSE